VLGGHSGGPGVDVHSACVLPLAACRQLPVLPTDRPTDTDGPSPIRPLRCSAYYWCYALSTGAYYKCQTGLLFNEAVSVCDWPANSGGGGSSGGGTC
jgi:hypothetical protein